MVYYAARDPTRDGWIKEFIKRKWSSGLFWAVRAAERKTLNFWGGIFNFLWAKNNWFFKKKYPSIRIEKLYTIHRGPDSMVSGSVSVCSCWPTESHILTKWFLESYFNSCSKIFIKFWNESIYFFILESNFSIVTNCDCKTMQILFYKDFDSLVNSLLPRWENEEKCTSEFQ